MVSFNYGVLRGDLGGDQGTQWKQLIFISHFTSYK